MLVFEEGGKPENLEGKPLEQGQEPTTNSTHSDVESGNRTWVTMVGGERPGPLRHPCSLWR